MELSSAGQAHRVGSGRGGIPKQFPVSGGSSKPVGGVQALLPVPGIVQTELTGEIGVAYLVV